MTKGKFPNGLAKAMADKDIGPTALGRLVDEPKQNIDRWAKQERRLTPEDAAKIAPHLEVTAAELLLIKGGESEPSPVSVVGYLGAGAEVEPEFEQVPPEGLFEVSVPFPLPAEMVAFEVRGDSMRPVYRDGHIIIVYRDQRKPLESFYGDEAAVRTSDGRRFIKTISRGPDGTVTLNSWNAAPLEGQKLEWVGELFAVLPPAAVRHMARKNGR